MSLPFHYVEFRTFCYATEAESRVKAALQTFLPTDADVERTVNEGHFGDPIVVLSTRLERADEIRHVFSLLRENLDFETLSAELPERIDDNNSLFLQFDKGAAFRGAVALGDGITFRAKVEAYPATRDGAIENARTALS
ncbi:MAG: RNA-binding protein [Halodesulfurarchaeum sp.]